MAQSYKIPVEIQIDFYFEGKRHAQRYGTHVPIIGDEVRFNNVAYKIEYRIWIYDEEYSRVALEMKQVKKASKKS